MAIVPLAPFVRFVIFGAATVYSNWDTISGLFDRHVEDPTSPIYGYYCQNVFEMKDASGAYSPRERGLFGVHYINTTGGDLDTTWTSADYAAVETATQTMISGRLSSLTPEVRFVEHRWYPFGPGVIPPSPPSRVTTLGSPLVGTGTGTPPHQVAYTYTLRTALRRHWGRGYLPYMGLSGVAGGQLSSSQVDTLANEVRTWLTVPNTSQGVMPVVWDRNRKVALGVSAIEVDSVPDIIRRRRARVTSYKKILTA